MIDYTADMIATVQLNALVGNAGSRWEAQIVTNPETVTGQLEQAGTVAEVAKTVSRYG